MVYSDVISNNWHKILPKKAKYTKKDVNKVLQYSLFNMQQTFKVKEAKFIVICTAIFHDAECSKYVMKNNPAEDLVR
jgi:hypothetical protein